MIQDVIDLRQGIVFREVHHRPEDVSMSAQGEADRVHLQEGTTTHPREGTTIHRRARDVTLARPRPHEDITLSGRHHADIPERAQEDIPEKVQGDPPERTREDTLEKAQGGTIHVRPREDIVLEGLRLDSIQESATLAAVLARRQDIVSHGHSRLRDVIRETGQNDIARPYRRDGTGRVGRHGSCVGHPREKVTPDGHVEAHQAAEHIRAIRDRRRFIISAVHVHVLHPSSAMVQGGQAPL